MHSKRHETNLNLCTTAPPLAREQSGRWLSHRGQGLTDGPLMLGINHVDHRRSSPEFSVEDLAQIHELFHCQHITQRFN